MPGNVCFVPLSGGQVVNIDPANPGAGNDWTYTVPAGYEMSLLSVCYRFTADATIAIRHPLFVMWGPDAFDRFRLRFALNITAGQVKIFSLAVGNARADSMAPANNLYMDTLPSVRLAAGLNWGAFAVSAGSTDAFSDIHMIVRQWRA